MFRMLWMTLLLCFTYLPLTLHATNSIHYMLIANDARAYIQDPELKNLLNQHLDAYLVGANFAESGFLHGTHYGTDAQSDKFISAFLAYLHEKYIYPEQQNPRLVAFLLGAAAHNKASQLFHQQFISQVAQHDFQQQWQTAHVATETALDSLININQHQWRVRPNTWWVPLHDLMVVYHLMGRDDVTTTQLFWGNAVYSFSGIMERVTSPITYAYTQWKMPWLAQHYYATSPGSILISERSAALYIVSIWQQIIHQPATAMHHSGSKTNQLVHQGSTPPTPSNRFIINKSIFKKNTQAVIA